MKHLNNNENENKFKFMSDKKYLNSIKIKKNRISNESQYLLNKNLLVELDLLPKTQSLLLLLPNTFESLVFDIQNVELLLRSNINLKSSVILIISIINDLIELNYELIINDLLLVINDIDVNDISEYLLLIKILSTKVDINLLLPFINTKLNNIIFSVINSTTRRILNTNPSTINDLSISENDKSLMIFHAFKLDCISLTQNSAMMGSAGASPGTMDQSDQISIISTKEKSSMDKKNSHAFHSKTTKWLEYLLNNRNWDMTTLFILMGHYGTKESMHDLFLLLYKRCDFDLLCIWIGMRKGSRIKDRDLLLNYIISNYQDTPDYQRMFATFCINATEQELVKAYKIIPKMNIPFYEFCRETNPKLFYQFMFKNYLNLIINDTKRLQHIATQGLDLTCIPQSLVGKKGIKISTADKQNLLVLDSIEKLDAISIFDVAFNDIYQNITLDCEKDVLGRVIGLLGHYSEETDKPKLLEIYTKILPNIDSNIDFLKGFKKLVLALSNHLVPNMLESIYDKLGILVGSLNKELRILAIEILQIYPQPNNCQILQLLLDIEMVVDGFHTEREKPILLRKLGQLVHSGTIPKLYENIAMRFALAQYGVNFSPLHKHINELVESIQQSYIEYNEMFEQLETCVEIEQIPNEEITKPNNLICTYFEQLKEIWRRIETQNYKKPIVPKLDYTNVWCLVMKSIGPKIALKSKSLMDTFFYITQQDSVVKNARLKLLAMLHMFKKVTAPRKLPNSGEFETQLIKFISNGDIRLQTAALQVYFNWQYNDIDKYKSTLLALAGDEFRDALTTMTMEEIRELNDYSRLLKVILSVLYGKVVSKAKKGSKSGLRARRVAIFGFLSTMTEHERAGFLELMYEPFKHILNNEFRLVKLDGLEYVADIKKQLGFLTVLEDFIKGLRSLILPNIPDMMTVLLHQLHYAESYLNNFKDDYLEPQARQVRLLGMKRITQIFATIDSFDFKEYIGTLFTSIITNRVEKLDTENTQAPSALLELIRVWCSNRFYVKYLNLNDLLFPQFLRLLTASKVANSVISIVLESVENILELQKMYPEDNIFELIVPHIELFLTQCQGLLENMVQDGRKLNLQGESIPKRIIFCIAGLAPFVTNSKVAEQLVSLIMPFLKQSDQKVSQTTKVEILEILMFFMPLLDIFKTTRPENTGYYSILSALFLTLSGRAARGALLKVFKAFVQFGLPETLVVLLENLNSWSEKRLDELDFDKWFIAFQNIQSKCGELTPLEWLPILYNMFYHVRNQEEFSIRTSASHVLVLFIETLKTKVEMVVDEKLTFQGLLDHTLFPQIKKGIKSVAQPARDEFIMLLGKLVMVHGEKDQFKDMVCLLGDVSDDETNFFSNMIHVQVHRRVKALRMLSGLARDKISHSNLSNIFINICSHIVFESDKVNDHNIINEAMACLGSCSSALRWGSYYGLLKRFMNALPLRPELEKVLVRLLVLILEEFRFVMKSNNSEMEIDDREEENEGQDDEEEQQEIEAKAEKIHNVVVTKLLPSLEKLIAIENDESIPVRIPLAVAVAKLLLQMPEESLIKQLPKLLLTLCSILSSHLQSSRDSTRNALVTISTLLGSKYLHYIIVGLRTALRRGYQLHVLGYTVHAILAANMDIYEVESINVCVKPIVEICVQDIFGETGKEREVQELKSKMREIRVNKSFDSLELLCRLISFNEIENIIVPVKEQMLESINVKFVKQVEEVFRKLALGINSNPSVDLEEFMIFVHRLLTESLPLVQPDGNNKKILTEAEKHVQVQMKREDFAANTLKYYEANVHLFVEFGLSLLLTSLKREKISLKEETHLQYLDPLVTLVGKALYSQHVGVVTLALKIFNIIVKWPLPNMEETKPVILKRLFELISRSSSTSSVLVQNVFKLLTIVLRDCKDVSIPEKKIITLMSLLEPDLDDPDRNATTFSLIRAILERKVVAAELYDLMDAVSKVLVTSQSETVRELCRHAFIQFLTKYPHGNNRLKKQLSFLISNLEYKFETGRCSVLEFLKMAIVKFEDDLFLEYVDVVFVSISMMIVNDDSSKCKEMAALLLKNIFKRLGLERIEKCALLIVKWFENLNPATQKLSLQLQGIFIDTFGKTSSDWAIKWINFHSQALSSCIEDWKEADTIDEDLPLWDLGYYSLKTLSKHFKYFPEIIVSAGNELWQHIFEMLTHPHQWNRLISCQLVGGLFSLLDPNTLTLVGPIAEKVENDVVFSMVSGEEDFKKLAKKFCAEIDSDFLNADLSKQITKNLIFITKAANFFIQSNDDLIEPEEQLMDEDSETKRKFINGSLISWLFSKLSFLSRTEGPKCRGSQLRTTVFQFFAAAYKHIPSKNHDNILRLMILTLLHTQQDESFRGSEAEALKSLATEVLGYLQKECEPSKFIELYQQVSNDIQQKRISRKEKKVMQAIIDPQSSAKAKIKKNLQKQIQRKRKTREFEEEKLRRGKMKKAWK